MDNSKHIQDLKEFGYTVIPDVLHPAQCDHLINLCDEAFFKYDSKIKATSNSTAFHGSAPLKMIYNLHNKHADFLPLFDHPVTFPIVKQMLQEGSYQNKEEVILKLSSARSPGDGAEAQQLHIDASIPGTYVPLVMQVIFTLHDFTAENGATRVVPGSHKRQAFAENNVKYSDEKILTAKRGSAIVYNGSLWHGSSEKMQPGDRWGVILTYGRWFMRPSFDHLRNTPREIYGRMNDSQKELLGFRFQPPKDEFERISRRSPVFEEPSPYHLPT